MKRPFAKHIRHDVPVAERLPLYEQLKAVLREQIRRGELKAGDRAPSEKELIHQYRVSSITARRCLNDLALEGYLQRVQGKGTFVRQHDLLKTTRHIGIFYHELASLTNAFITTVLKGIFDQLGHSQYQPELLSWQPIRNSLNPPTVLREMIRQRQVDGILIISPAPLAWLREVLDDGLPIVSVNMEYAHPRVFGVVNDATLGIQRLMSRCRELSHRRIVIMEEVFREPTEGVIPSSVLANWNGGPLRVNHETLDYSDAVEAERIIAKHLAAPDPATLFLAYGYELALMARHILEQRGLSIPRDVSLVHWGVAPGPLTFHQEEVPALGIGGEATRILGTLLARHVPPDRVVRIPTRTRQGQTLGPAPTLNPSLPEPALTGGSELLTSTNAVQQERP